MCIRDRCVICSTDDTYPEITEMQARAIFEAAVEVSQEEGFAVVPEIMVPLVAFKKELDIQKAIIDKVRIKKGDHMHH